MTTLTQEHRNHTVAPGLWAALRASVAQWSAHKDARVGAAIAYYSIFSIGPLIVVAISIASLVFDREGVQREVISSLQSLIGNKGAESVNSMLGAAGSQGEGLFATAIGVVTLLYAAISLVVQLKEAMNSVWEVETTPGSGLWGFVRIYVLSLAGVVTGGFLLLVSMLLAAGLAAFGKYIGTFIPEALLQGAGFFVSLGVISLVFALMFKWLPDADVSWRDVWLGTVGTAALFEIGKYVIAFYIGKQGLESKYGAAASIVVVLVWIYYTAQLILLGAEFTNVRHRQHSVH